MPLLLFDQLEDLIFHPKNRKKQYNSKVKCNSSFFQAEFYIGLEKWTKAETILQRILKQDPEHDVALYQLSQVYLEQNQTILGTKISSQYRIAYYSFYRLLFPSSLQLWNVSKVQRSKVVVVTRKTTRTTPSGSTAAALPVKVHHGLSQLQP